jgi:hypothetical protein
VYVKSKTFIAAIAVLLASQVIASPVPTTYFVEDPLKWARPLVVVPPKYPATQLAASVTGTVEAVLSLKDSGGLESIVSITSEPKVPEFEAAVQDVVKSWKFAQSFDPTCKPVGARSRMKVWFEIKEGKPSISVTHMPSSLTPGTSAIKELNRPAIAKLLLETFPPEARREGKEAQVHARLTVDAATGLVSKVTIAAMTADPSIYRVDRSGGGLGAGRRQASIAEQFAASAHHALSAYKFEPPAGTGSEPLSVCRHIAYLLRSEE